MPPALFLLTIRLCRPWTGSVVDAVFRFVSIRSTMHLWTTVRWNARQRAREISSRLRFGFQQRSGEQSLSMKHASMTRPTVTVPTAAGGRKTPFAQASGTRANVLGKSPRPIPHRWLADQVQPVDQSQHGSALRASRLMIIFSTLGLLQWQMARNYPRTALATRRAL